MNTTIQALQALYIKLGGNLTDTYEAIADGAQVGNYTTIPDMIEACTQKAESGGSALPAVTTDDNSKLLTVVNGEWDKADAPKELPNATNLPNDNVLKVSNGRWLALPENEIKRIYFDYNETDDEWVCDTSAEEVLSWIGNGKTVFAHVNIDDFVAYIIPFTGLAYNDGVLVGVAFATVAAANSTNVRAVTSVYVGYSALGISVNIQSGYLSETDPNT